MNLVGSGVDIVYLPRIARLIKKYPINNTKHAKDNNLWNKFLHRKELEHCIQLRQSNDKDKLLTYIGGCWSLKEATFKALNNYIPRDSLPTAQFIYHKLIYRTYSTQGIPLLNFDQTHYASEFITKYIDQYQLICSISHDTDYLIAIVNIVKSISNGQE